MGTTDKMQTKSEKGNGIAVGITVYTALTSTGLCSAPALSLSAPP